MTNLPNSGQSDSMDNTSVTRNEFRTGMNQLLQYLAEALGNQSGYTTQSIASNAVKLNGSPTAPTQASSDNSTKIATTAFVQNAVGGGGGDIPSGTAMLFQQTSAPTGWTKLTSHNNKALRVVSGTASSGGSVGFTTAFSNQTTGGSVDGHTLTEAQIPSHTHTFDAGSGMDLIIGPGSSGPGRQYLDARIGNGNWNAARNLISGSGGSGNTGATGSGSSHSHGFTGGSIDLRVTYVDVIIATKD